MGDDWWRGNCGTIQLLKKDDVIYVLNNWDGEFYLDCYKSDMRGVPIDLNEKFIVKRIKEPYGYEVIKVN